METTAELMIMVTDFNDRNPVFEHSRYSAQVYENLTVVCVITSLYIFKKQNFFAYCACMSISLCSYISCYVRYMSIVVLVYLVQLYWCICCCVICPYDQLSIAILHQ